MDIGVKSQAAGDLSLSGSMSRQVMYLIFLSLIYIIKKEEIDVNIEGNNTDEFHLAKIGKLVEFNESSLKNSFENVHFAKTKQVNII